MSQQEGVIRFQLEFTPAPPMLLDSLREINAWRKILHLTQLIGQAPDRYCGFGYGNISQRLGPFDAPEHQRRFVVSGTQTGRLADLTEEHYATVLECYPDQNLVVAEGPIRPSSESLTHGTLYALDDSLRCAIHAHSPHIWRSAQALGIPITHEDVTYGTPEMAEEVRRLFQETSVRDRLIFAMGGHEDGVVSFGRTAEEAGTVLLRYLARAFQQASSMTST
ncbi:MAG: class II aldolase/adducin family protein [Anaerolineae bacterium]